MDDISSFIFLFGIKINLLLRKFLTTYILSPIFDLGRGKTRKLLIETHRHCKDGKGNLVPSTVHSIKMACYREDIMVKEYKCFFHLSFFLISEFNWSLFSFLHPCIYKKIYFPFFLAISLRFL